jgi:hypothetical protein
MSNEKSIESPQYNPNMRSMTPHQKPLIRIIQEKNTLEAVKKGARVSMLTSENLHLFNKVSKMTIGTTPSKP